MPISAAKTEQASRHRGFTLVELLVVFALMGLLIAIAPPAYERLREATLYRSTLRQLIVDLKQARAEAQAQGQWVSFELDLNHNHYRWHATKPEGTIPKPLSVRVTTGDAYINPGQSASILFSPDGGSTGGSIELLRAHGEGVSIKVDWLTGEITQNSLSP